MRSRIVTKTPIGEKSVRHRVRITDFPTEPGSDESRRSLFRFMGDLVANPHLLSCGFAPPQKISIIHSGAEWVAEAEAIVNEE